ncbi:hypothetical protein [Hydrogenophaga sp.]|uniref:hypothetical protein n=1 Tax=Hydrogenophaga sp. TaxID=1904254 RepID=UPI00271C653C|nr:hypothetical protein [Hydrogenophaga sp.]MDO9504814.1 hypothetical protein [Hydrogenophaga sp.]
MGEYFRAVWPIAVAVAFSLLLIKALINTYQGKSLLARRRRCNVCDHLGKTVLRTPGSFLVELLLWGLAGLGGVLVLFLFEKIGMFAFAFLLLSAPLPFYSYMRILGRSSVCGKCGSDDLGS